MPTTAPLNDAAREKIEATLRSLEDRGEPGLAWLLHTLWRETQRQDARIAEQDERIEELEYVTRNLDVMWQRLNDLDARREAVAQDFEAGMEPLPDLLVPVIVVSPAAPLSAA